MADKRVVVKRPDYAGWLNEHKPSMAIETKSNRFDVWRDGGAGELSGDWREFERQRRGPTRSGWPLRSLAAGGRRDPLFLPLPDELQGRQVRQAEALSPSPAADIPPVAGSLMVMDPVRPGSSIPVGEGDRQLPAGGDLNQS